MYEKNVAGDKITSMTIESGCVDNIYGTGRHNKMKKKKKMRTKKKKNSFTGTFGCLIESKCRS